MKALFAFFLSTIILHAYQRPFVIVIPSYNNSKYVNENLKSCLNQKYDNFRVIYVNDKSNDDTLEKVNKLSKQHPFLEIINNSERKYALQNIYDTIHEKVCNDEIVVLVDGDDRLADTNVLSYLNQVYSSEDVLLTYGQFGRIINGSLLPGEAKPLNVKHIKKNTYRRDRLFPFTHLRTFYAWLFKRINPRSLKDSNNTFYRSAWDLAIMYPMLEMSGGKFKYIDKILYIYNSDNPISDHKVRREEQFSFTKKIRKLRPYKPLNKRDIPNFED